MASDRELNEHLSDVSDPASPDPHFVMAGKRKKSPSQESLLDLKPNSVGIERGMFQFDGKPLRLKPKHYVYLCTFLACLSSVLLGYDVGVMSGAIVYMQRDLGLSQWRTEILISSLNLFSIFGALFGGHISHIIGRRKTISISAVIFFVGASLISASRSYGLILFGRVILGIGTGIGLMIAPLYTAELAPHSLRGRLVTFAEICINVGILLGYFVAWCFTPVQNDEVAWRVMIALGTIPAMVLFIAMFFAPYSPRWLLEQGRDRDAYNVLYKVYGDDEIRILNEMIEIKQTIEIEHKSEDEYSCGGWSMVLCPADAYIRHALLIGVGISFFQQATGSEAAVYYTPYIFSRAGVPDNRLLLYTTFVGLGKVAFIFVSTCFLDTCGRRPLLLTSAICMTFTLLGLSIAFWIDSEEMIVVSQISFMSAFSIGWGPITWVIISEIFPLQIRSKAMAICTLVNRLMSGTVALTFLSLQDAITAHGAWLMYTCISALSVLFVYKYVPETKQKTLEQITKFLMQNYTDKKRKNHGVNVQMENMHDNCNVVDNDDHEDQVL